MSGLRSRGEKREREKRISGGCLLAVSLGLWDIPAGHGHCVFSFVPPAQCLVPSLNPRIAVCSGLLGPTHLSAGQFTEPFTYMASLVLIQRPCQECDHSGVDSGLPKSWPSHRMAKQSTRGVPAWGYQSLSSEPSRLALDPMLCLSPMLPASTGQKRTPCLNDKWSPMHAE